MMHIWLLQWYEWPILCGIEDKLIWSQLSAVGLGITISAQVSAGLGQHMSTLSTEQILDYQKVFTPFLCMNIWYLDLTKCRLHMLPKCYTLSPSVLQEWPFYRF